MTKPSPRQEPEAPALIREHHVQDRFVNKGDREQSGWTALSVFERTWRKGQLAEKELIEKGGKIAEEEARRAQARYAAGREFTELWLICQASFPGGSDYSRVRVVGTPGSFCDHQTASKAFLRRVEAAMGSRDWMIVRRVCGEDYAVADAVAQISPSYRKSTLARFRESLDALVDGMEAARRA
jgi:hypothetical protein